MKKTGLFIIAALTILIISAAGPAVALDPVPKESGFSGFIKPGAGYLNVKSNMAASYLGFDLSKERISSLTDSPESESTGIVLMPFSLEYTFADTGTQLFVGPDVSDLVRFDFGQQAGIKQDVGTYGILQASFMFSTVPTKVWEDPYMVGRDRDDTDRTNTGLRLAWDRILDTRLEVQYTYRSIDIDDEKSGEFLGLPSGDRGLLDRNGDRHAGEILYRFRLTEEHRLTPAFRYARDDMEGDAMSSDTYDFQLTYAYVRDPLVVILNGFIGTSDYDRRNPVYDKTQEDDRYGISGEVLYKNPWGWSLFGSDPISFYVNAAYMDIDANIDFYDQVGTLATAGAFIKW